MLYRYAHFWEPLKKPEFFYPLKVLPAYVHFF